MTMNMVVICHLTGAVLAIARVACASGDVASPVTTDSGTTSVDAGWDAGTTPTLSHATHVCHSHIASPSSS